MSLGRFNLVCMKAAVIDHIGNGRLTRPLLIICNKIDAPVTFDHSALASCNTSKRFLRVLEDYFNEMVFRWLKSSGRCVPSPDSIRDLCAVVIR